MFKIKEITCLLMALVEFDVGVVRSSNQASALTSSLGAVGGAGLPETAAFSEAPSLPSPLFSPSPSPFFSAASERLPDGGAPFNK